MKPKEYKELLQHPYRRIIARFCLEPRTFEEVIGYMMEKVGWNHDLAYVLVGEHIAMLEKKQAMKPVDDRWMTTDAAAEALRRYF